MYPFTLKTLYCKMVLSVVILCGDPVAIINFSAKTSNFKVCIDYLYCQHQHTRAQLFIALLALQSR